MSTKEYKGIGVLVKKGFEIPEGYLKAISKWEHNLFGMVTIKNDGSCLEIGYVEGRTTHQGLYDWMRRTNAKDRLLYFGMHPVQGKGLMEANRQPLLLLKKDAKPFLACVLTGDFKKHIPPGSTDNSGEFFCANTKIIPDLQQIFRLCKDDPKQFWDELSTAASQKRLSDMIGLPGGCISIFAASNGDDVGIKQYFRSLPTFGQYDWGTTTDKLDYVFDKNEKPAPITAESVAKPKPKSKFAVTIEEEEDNNSTGHEEKANEEVPTVPPLSSLADKPERKTHQIITSDGNIIREIIVDGTPTLLWYPGEHLSKRRKLKAAYKEACGRDLTNHELNQRIGVTPKAQWLIDQWNKESKSDPALPADAVLVKDLVGSDAPREKKPTEGTLPEQAAKNTVTGGLVNVSKSEEDTHYPSSSVHEDRPSGASPIYSVITPKDKHTWKEITKNLDKNGQVISDPTVAQDMEESQNFAEEIGYPGLSSTFGWKDDFIFNMMQHAPHIAIRWTLALRRRINLLEQELSRHEHDPAIKREEEEELIANFKPKRKRA